jgi:hypothetical protein
MLGLNDLDIDEDSKSIPERIEALEKKAIIPTEKPQEESVKEIDNQTAMNDDDFFVRRTAIQELARGWHHDPEALSILKMATNDKNKEVSSTAVQELASYGWLDDNMESLFGSVAKNPNI